MKLFTLDDYEDVEDGREDFHFERPAKPIELGFVNEHVTFTDESDNEEKDVMYQITNGNLSSIMELKDR